MSELLGCPTCRRLHVERAPAEAPEQQQLHCGRCGTSSAEFRDATNADLDAAGMPPVIYECVLPETPQQAGVAGGMYEVSDEEMMRRIKTLRRSA